MPKSLQEKTLESIATFFRNDPPSLFMSLCFSSSTYSEATRIAGEIKRLTSHQSTIENILFLNRVSELLVAHKNHSSAAEPLQALKTALSMGGSLQWKEAILQIRLTFIYTKGAGRQQRLMPFKRDVALPIEFQSPRFVGQSGVGEPHAHYRVAGTTFVTNKPAIINRQTATPQSEEKILDALCVARLTDGVSVPSLLMAIGDGCGGHYGDVHQDQQIWRAAHFATKNAVRFMAAYTDAELLKQQLPQIIHAIAREVRCKLGSVQEGTTLAAVRTFPVANSAEYRVVGFSIGDSIVAVWDPQSEQCTTLLPARQWVSGLSGQAATAIFPLAYRDAEIQWIDTMVPQHSILFGFTDGGYEGLPCTVTQVIESNGDHFQSIQLDSQAIRALFAEQQLSTASPVKDYVHCLIASVIEQANAKRIEQQAEAASAQQQLDELQRDADAAQGSPTFWKRRRNQLDTLFSRSQIQLGDDVMLAGMKLQ